MAKRTHKFLCKSQKKNILRQEHLLFHWLILGLLNGSHSTYTELGWMAKRSETCFDLLQSRQSGGKSSQVNASACKTWPNSQSQVVTQVFTLRLLVIQFVQGVRCKLSPGQTDLQVVPSGRKLKLRRDVLGGKTDSQVHSSCKKDKHFKADSCISLAKNRLMNVGLALTWVG